MDLEIGWVTTEICSSRGSAAWRLFGRGYLDLGVVRQGNVQSSAQVGINRHGLSPALHETHDLEVRDSYIRDIEFHSTSFDIVTVTVDRDFVGHARRTASVASAPAERIANSTSP